MEIYEQEKIKSLTRDRFKFTCDLNYFYLNTGIKRYKFKRTNEIFEEYFRKQKKAYFEKKWEESPIDRDMPDIGIKTMDRLYNFNFDSFYNNIYKQLTENQQIIIAFFMLNVMEIHQAKMMKVSQPYISLEIKRIAEKKSRLSKKIDWLKKYLSISLENNGEEKKELGTFSLSFRKSQKLIIENEDKISEEFKKKKEIISIDKLAIKKEIKNGAVIEGAKIETSKNLQIK